MSFDLNGKVAMVTGGAGGIGTAYCRALAEAGAAVAVADIDSAAAEAAAKALSGAGHKAIGVTLDVTDEDSAKAAVAQVTAAFGGLDILVNNAGIMSALPKGKLLDLPLAAYELALRVNATSILVCAKAGPDAHHDDIGFRVVRTLAQ